jgi:predicted murein hydrolase (TIGR00659 family)
MLWMLALTLLVFFLAKKLAQLVKTPLCNPLLVSVLILIPIMLLSKVTYSQYAANVKILNDLLSYSVVALAYPLYELLPQIKERWRSIMFITVIASISAMITGVCIAFWLGASPEIAASILPKSVTTPIAVTISAAESGIPSIAAFCVIFVGISGALFGHLILNLFKVKLPVARGLAIGAVSHAVGTARCIEVDYEEGAYSTLALVLCGIFTSITAPFLFPIMLFIYQYF